MSSPPASPNCGAQSDSDFETNKKKKKKTGMVPIANNKNTQSGGGNRMSLRDATQRRLPGRYREVQEIPDTKPVWVHPTVPFNAKLASFVEPYSLPMDSPNGHPSRVRYEAWLREQHSEEKRKQEAEQQGVEYVTVNVRAEVQNGSSKGPDVVHLPPLSKPRQGQLQPLIDEGEVARAAADDFDENLDEDEVVVDQTITLGPTWQDLSKCTQWILIDHQNKKVQSYDEDLGLPDAFRSLHLRLSDIIKFAESYNHEKNIYEQWCTRIKNTQPAQNALDLYYDDVWTNLDLTTYIVSDKEILRGQEYLVHIGENNVHELKNIKGRHRKFFHIADMHDLDVAFLKQCAQHGVDLEYGDLTPKSINWILYNSAEGLNDPVGQHQVKQPEPRTPESLKEELKPDNLDGAASDNNDHELDWPALSNPDLALGFDPFYYAKDQGVPHPPVEWPEEKLQEVGGDRLVQPALFLGGPQVLDVRPQLNADVLAEWNSAEMLTPRTLDVLKLAPNYFGNVDLSNFPLIQPNDQDELQQAQQGLHQQPYCDGANDLQQPFEQQEHIQPLDDGACDLQQQEETAVGGGLGSAMLHAQMVHGFGNLMNEDQIGSLREQDAQIAAHDGPHKAGEEFVFNQQDFEFNPHFNQPMNPANYLEEPNDQVAGHSGPQQGNEEFVFNPQDFELNWPLDLASNFEQSGDQVARNDGPHQKALNPANFLGQPENEFVGDNDLYQEGKDLGFDQLDLDLSHLCNAPLDVDALLAFGGAELGPVDGDSGPEIGDNMSPEQGIQALADAVLVPEISAEMGEDLESIDEQDHQSQSPRYEGSGLLPIRTPDAPVHVRPLGSIYQGIQDMVGFPPPPPDLDSVYADVRSSSSSNDRSYERKVTKYGNKLQDSIEAHRVGHYRENNDLNSDDNGPGDDLRFDLGWWEHEQPVIHRFPREFLPSWDDRAAWLAMLGHTAQATQHGQVAQRRQVVYKEGDLLGSFVPGQPLPDTLIDPRLRGAGNNNGAMGHVSIPGQPQPALNQSRTAHAIISNTGNGPAVASASNNAVIHSPNAEASGSTPAQSQVSRANTATTGPAPKQGSTSMGFRLALVETPDGQAILQREPVVENGPRTIHHRIPSKRVLDEFLDDSDDDPVMVTPIRQRRRSHRKETAALESDEDFLEVGVPICESDDEDYVEPTKSPYPRKGKNISVTARGKKTAATPRGRKKVDEAVEEEITVKLPKRKYARKNKNADKANDGAPASVPTSAAAGPAIDDPSMAAVPMPPWPHAASFNAVYGSNDRHGPSTRAPTRGASAPVLPWPHLVLSGLNAGSNNFAFSPSRLPCVAPGRNNPSAPPTPPVSKDSSAYPIAGVNGINSPSNGFIPAAATRVTHIPQEVPAVALEPPVQKPKRKYTPRRPKKEKEGEAGDTPKPKRARTKKADTANKEAPGLNPFKGRKETPVPLPPILKFHPGSEGGSVAGNRSAPSNTRAVTPKATPKATPKGGAKASARAGAKAGVKTAPKAGTKAGAKAAAPKAAPKAGPKAGSKAGPETSSQANIQFSNYQPQVESNPGLPQKGLWPNPISPEEFEAMSRRGELLQFGQLSQADGSDAGAPAPVPPQSNGSYVVMVPAFCGIPIIPQASYPRPEASMSSLADAFTGVYAPSMAMRPDAPASPSPEGPLRMPLPATLGSQSLTERSSTANVEAGNKDDVAGNVQEAQKKISARIKTARPIAPAPKRSAPAAGAVPFTTQYESFFAPIQTEDGSVMQEQPTPTAQKPKPQRRNTIDPKTGRPRIGRPRLHEPKKTSTQATQQPQTEQADVAGNDAGDQDVAASVNAAQ